ncbi:MAG: hypothetical protein HYS18_11500 [Burkholderiales bacterium]|nr:hypothetical protein [Burkholderiales bacterium]
MNAEEFVESWRREKEILLRSFMSESGSSFVAAKIRSMDLSEDQLAEMRSVLDAALTDTMYTLLLGLDGAASIGDIQQTYKILDEDGRLISESGDIESEAWRQFHGNT